MQRAFLTRRISPGHSGRCWASILLPHWLRSIFRSHSSFVQTESGSPHIQSWLPTQELSDAYFPAIPPTLAELSTFVWWLCRLHALGAVRGSAVLAHHTGSRRGGSVKRRGVRAHPAFSRSLA